MRLALIAMGLWERWIILGLLRPFGMVHLTCGLIRLLYRAGGPFVRRPIWTAVGTHLILLALFVSVLGVLAWRMMELLDGPTGNPDKGPF